MAYPHDEGNPRTFVDDRERSTEACDASFDPIAISERRRGLLVEAEASLERENGGHRMRDQPAARERKPGSLHAPPRDDVGCRSRPGCHDDAYARRTLDEAPRVRAHFVEGAHRFEPILWGAPERIEHHALWGRQLEAPDRQPTRDLVLIAYVEAYCSERGLPRGRVAIVERLGLGEDRP
jgi:hypothetical protein